MWNLHHLLREALFLPPYKGGWLFQTNADQPRNVNKYINVKGKLWNNNQSILCGRRERKVINSIPTHDADTGISSVLWAIFMFYVQRLITERR